MNYYGVTRSTDHLAHYGVKGMRWGVRKAIVSGNQKALARHYRKAAKKLAKLQDIGLNSKKYAAKSAAYGAAAAGTGTLAIGGTNMLGSIISNPAKALAAVYEKKHNVLARRHDAHGKMSSSVDALYNQYKGIRDAGLNVQKWGNKYSGVNLGTTKSKIKIGKDAKGNVVYGNKLIALTNNDLYRIGMGATTVGLAAKSAQNAYRASHGAKYREKAHDWRNAMDEVFSGTQYQGHYEKLPRKKRRR